MTAGTGGPRLARMWRGRVFKSRRRTTGFAISHERYVIHPIEVSMVGIAVVYPTVAADGTPTRKSVVTKWSLN